jgi:cob(I)alamin adenosyltransferase
MPNKTNLSIYTKKGDEGYTSTLKNSNISKSEKVFEVLGELDELSSHLGFVYLSRKRAIKQDIKTVQENLLLLGSYIAGSKIDFPLQECVAFLENRIDFYDSLNAPLKNFILFSGNYLACHTFLARAVCRRVERTLVRNSSVLPPDNRTLIIAYLNRLSDFLFVVARNINKSAGNKETIWRHTR